MREFSPLGLRADRLEEELSPIDTRTAAGAIWSPDAHVYLLGDTARHAGTPWHHLASLIGATFVHCVKDEPFAGRGKPGPRVDNMGEILVAAEQRQAEHQALLPHACKCLSQQ